MSSEVERLTRLETQMDNIEKKVDDGFYAIIKRLDALDNKYANKWTENVLKSVIYTVGIIIVGAIMVLLLKKGLVTQLP